MALKGMKAVEKYVRLSMLTNKIDLMFEVKS